MRTALAIVAVLLALESFAGFTSEFCDTGDFPRSDFRSVMPLQPKLKDKYAHVAMCAALGELKNGMYMRFDVDAPLVGTPLESWSNLVTAAKANNLDHTLVHGAMLKDQVSAVCNLYANGYGGTYGGVKMCGIVTNMNFSVAAGDAASVAFDMSNAAYSNMKTLYNVDYALFREVGAYQPNKSVAVREAIKSAYQRIFGTAIENGTPPSICLEYGVDGYGFHMDDGSELPNQSSLDVAWWKAGILDASYTSHNAFAYRQLFYAPQTWYNAPWAPQNVGMMFECVTNCIAIETRARVRKATATVRVTRTVNDDTVDFHFQLIGNTASTTETYSTNFVSNVSNVRLTGSLSVVPCTSADIPMMYANHNYDYNPPRMLTSGEPYQVTTNGNTYWCQKMHAMPCAWTNSEDHLDIPIEYTVTTTNQRFVAAFDGDDAFPSTKGYLKAQMLANAACDGWAFDDSRIVVATNVVLTYEGAPMGMKKCVATKLIPEAKTQIGATAFDAIAEHHDYDTVFENGLSPEEDSLARLSPSDTDYPFDPDEVYVFEGRDPESGTLYGYLGHTKDFETFSFKHVFSPILYGVSVFGNDEPPMHYRTWIGDQNWNLSAVLKTAVFGFWRFTRWAHK